jgi:hypothetical protein
MARYKVTKDQLERIVESFVMESSIESKKAPVKNMIPSQGADAKKHVKNKMSGNMVEKGEGVPQATPMKKKLSQSADAKKHVSSAKTTHNNKAKVVKEEEEVTSKPNPQEIMSHLKSALKGIDMGAIKKSLEAKGIDSKEEAKEVVKKAVKNVNTDNMADYMKDYMGGEDTEDNMLGEESFFSKHKGKIGVALLVAGLTALGIKGELQSQIIGQMSEDSVLINVLKDPVWVAGALSALAGTVIAGSAYGDEQKKSSLAGRLQVINQAKKSGKFKAYSEEVKDKQGNVIGLKDPNTGKTFPANLNF